MSQGSVYGVTLHIPPADARSLAWWKRQADRHLDYLLGAAERCRYSSTRFHLQHGSIAVITAYVETRPAGG